MNPLADWLRATDRQIVQCFPSELLSFSIHSLYLFRSDWTGPALSVPCWNQTLLSIAA